MKKYLLPILALIAVAGCIKKETRVSDGWLATSNGPDLSNVFASVAAPEQTFTVKAGDSSSLVTTKGILFRISPNSFVNSNMMLSTGNIHLKITEYFTNADLLAGGVETVTSDHKLLITGGSFNIIATDDQHQPLSLVKSMAVSVPSKGRLNTSNLLFPGYVPPSTSAQIAWSPVWSIDTIGLGITFADSSYNFMIRNLSWWNVDHYTHTSDPTTNFQVQLPEGLGNDNTRVILMCPENGLMNLYPDAKTKTFGATLPIGLPIKVLSISKLDGQVSYDLRSLTIGVNAKSVVKTMQPITDQGLADIILHGLN